MTKTLAIALTLAAALATGVQAEQTRRAGGGTNLTAQIDGLVSGAGRGTVASDGGLGTGR